jgi:dihydroxyacetone kinase DhaKLM complex PTS-EIIA-like component DhaM
VGRQGKASGRFRSWRIGRAVRAWEKAYAERSKFLLTAEEEALLRDELGEAALMAQFAELEAADRRERKRVLEAPVINGFFRGAIKRINADRG